jgi:uncharacterized membrane protein
LDWLRGLAVALMVVDHVLVQLEPRSVLRETVTRLSLPLFCVVAGSLAQRRPRWGRLASVGMAGVGATALGAPIGIGQPDVLLVIVAAMLALSLLWRCPVAALCVGAVQPFTWPFPGNGYQVGTVLVMLVAGRLAGAETVAGWARRCRPLEWAGRHPLALYVGHLAVLRAVVALLA